MLRWAWLENPVSKAIAATFLEEYRRLFCRRNVSDYVRYTRLGMASGQPPKRSTVGQLGGDYALNYGLSSC